MSTWVSEGQRVLGVLAQLLSYPDAQWRHGLEDVAREISGLADSHAASVLTGFVSQAAVEDAAQREAAYVSAFDFNKKTSLYLTARGRNDAAQQRADLLAYSLYYTESGFEPDHELPDYLPALLELASAVDIDQAVRIMRGAQADLELLRDALAEAGQDRYRALVDLTIAVGRELEQEVAA